LNSRPPPPAFATVARTTRERASSPVARSAAPLMLELSRELASPEGPTRSSGYASEPLEDVLELPLSDLRQLGIGTMDDLDDPPQRLPRVEADEVQLWIGGVAARLVALAVLAFDARRELNAAHWPTSSRGRDPNPACQVLSGKRYRNARPCLW